MLVISTAGKGLEGGMTREQSGTKSCCQPEVWVCVLVCVICMVLCVYMYAYVSIAVCTF